ncbi:hypothetical protein P692DRAFT_20829045 [Suillus brevipes Sb2]|nr:hypothetical protein P692DRAFT_20829045 [Suillus brevipes Sb2]
MSHDVKIHAASRFTCRVKAHSCRASPVWPFPTEQPDSMLLQHLVSASSRFPHATSGPTLRVGSTTLCLTLGVYFCLPVASIVPFHPNRTTRCIL